MSTLAAIFFKLFFSTDADDDDVADDLIRSGLLYDLWVFFPAASSSALSSSSFSSSFPPPLSASPSVGHTDVCVCVC